MHQTLLRWSLGRQRAASTPCIPGTLTTGTTRSVCGWSTLGKAIGWRSLLSPQTCSGLIPRPSALGTTMWRSKMVSWTDCFSVFLLDCIFLFVILFLGRKPVGPVAVFELVGVRELLLFVCYVCIFVLFRRGGGWQSGCLRGWFLLFGWNAHHRCWKYNSDSHGKIIIMFYYWLLF